MKVGRRAAAMLAPLLLLSACGPASTPDEAAFQELIEEVEAHNASIDAPSDELDRYKYSGNGPTLTYDEWMLAFDEGGQAPDTLPVEDALAEVDYLFRLLRTYYGLYNWSGGDEAFGVAQEQVLTGLEGLEAITVGDYNALLHEALSTCICDAHFVLGGYRYCTPQVLHCNEELLFERRDGIFYLDDRQVLSVDGQDPAGYMKRAIGPEGELTWKLYWPSPESLSVDVRVTFEDGTEGLSLPPIKDTDYTIGMGPNSVFRMQEQDGTLFLQMDQMPFGPEDDVSKRLKGDGEDKAAFLAAAEASQDYPVAVVNLTQNVGGNGALPDTWFQAFAEEPLEPNYATLRTDPFGAFPNAEDGYVTSRPGPQFLPRKDGPFLLILTSKNTASAAEDFTDLAHDLGRTLVVGSNTGGVLTGSQTWPFLTLPWSKLPLAFGSDLFLWPEGYFQEGVGLEPDIYLTGTGQADRLSAFLHRYLLPSPEPAEG